MGFSVTHAELPGYPKEEQERFYFRATRKLICDWADRHTLAAEALHFPGDLYPYKTSYLARAQSAGIEPFVARVGGTGDANERASYDKAIVTIVYETPGADTPQALEGSGTAAIKYSETMDPRSEMITLDHGGFEWPDGTPLEPDESPSRLVNGWEYSFTIHNALTLPNSALTLTGHVNSGAVIPRLINNMFEAETLLYLGPSVSRVTEIGTQPSSASISGSRSSTKLNVVHRFWYRPGGWNKFQRSVSSASDGFEAIYESGGGEYKTYPLGNFLELTFG